MQHPPALRGMRVHEIDTPALVVDLDALRRNIATMAGLARRAGLVLRPHAKSHKSAAIARLQVEAGAVGLCCQKVSEAEALVEAGAGDILVTNEVVGDTKLRRLVALAQRARIAVLADHGPSVELLGRLAAERGAFVRVLVEVETGDRRCGVGPAEAARLAGLVRDMPNLTFGGIQAYKGSVEHTLDHTARRFAVDEVMAVVRETLAALRAVGIPCGTVTGGGTGTCGLLGQDDPLTELQPGSYVFMDGNYHLLRGADGGDEARFEQSLHLHATMMSRGGPDRGMVDAGTKALSLEAGLPLAADHPGMRYVRGDDEHGRIVFEPGARQANVGDRVRLIPSNCDPTVNLHDWYVVVQGDVVVDLWPVTARGAIF
jgi:3-hydroxy-D-aspartate aldolase